MIRSICPTIFLFDFAFSSRYCQEMVMGDLNAKVGIEQDPQKVVVGQHGLGERNERGDLWTHGF